MERVAIERSGLYECGIRARFPAAISSFARFRGNLTYKYMYAVLFAEIDFVRAVGYTRWLIDTYYCH